VRLQNWLAGRARLHMHFVPASSSWLKHLERWFGELIIKLLQRGVHTPASTPSQANLTISSGTNPPES
jgi:hypothetical protein